MARTLLGLGSVVFGTAAVLALIAQTRPTRTKFVTEIQWAGRGEWIRADTHIHTKFSDGGHFAPEVAEQAVRNGCQAIAITDHASGATSAAYAATIQALRASRPDLIVIAGMEWNPPPYGSREHASILVPEHAAEGVTIAEFKQRFDDFERKDGITPPVGEALEWLAQATKNLAARPVVVYNHPSRKDDSSLDNVDDIVRWRATSDLVIGFEGAPGHQGNAPIGSYEGKESPIDRWDPAVARPGDAWDTLLQRGVDISGAMASSDFHSADPKGLNDFWPCQFAETWYYVPERTAAGVLRAMRAGAFFGVHGHIAQRVELTVNASGLLRPATAGESVEAPAGTAITASVRLLIPDTDWHGQPNRVDAVEFIVLTPGNAVVHSHAVSGTGARTVSQSVVLGPEGVVIRARGRRVVADGPDLMFYTNAIRVRAAR